MDEAYLRKRHAGRWVTDQSAPAADPAEQALFGRTVAEADSAFSDQPVNGGISRDWLAPPTTILDTKQGHWQDRKAQWIETFGIQSEVGREHVVTYQIAAQLKKARAEGTDDLKYVTMQIAHTSIFDPVLCECVYEWFCPRGGTVLDPFAGGSVRGIVANVRGRRYTGIELSEQQVDANRTQADVAFRGRPPDRQGWYVGNKFSVAECVRRRRNGQPEWVVGDANDIPQLVGDRPPFDLVFTCPPYGDLEVYSDDPRDVSTRDTYTGFLEAFEQIAAKAADRLADNRFAVYVVGAFRDRKEGKLRDFPGDTIRIHERLGLEFYNHSILATAVGSASIRLRRGWETYRKMVKVHQDVLVFVKGDPVAAAEAVIGTAGHAAVADARLESRVEARRNNREIGGTIHQQTLLDPHAYRRDAEPPVAGKTTPN